MRAIEASKAGEAGKGFAVVARGSARRPQAVVSQASQALANLQRASESIRGGARLLGDLSSRAHGLSEPLQRTAGTSSLPRAEA